MTGATQQSDPATLVGTTHVRIVPHDAWDDTVARLGGDDVYLRLGWHRASVHLEDHGARPVLLLVATDAGDVALPLLVRPLPDGRAGFDATSCYGYGGPLAAGDVDLAAFGERLDEWAAANGVVASFLRLHPVLGNHRLVPPTAELVELGSTVSWDVSGSRDLMEAMHTHHRRAVRKAERVGVQVRVTESPDDLAEFRATYDHTMRRQDAAAFYFFSDAYWDALRAGPGGDVVLVDALLEGEPAPIASLLCVAHGEHLHYHLGASADAARNIGASNACFLAAARWAQERGMRDFHLGGGVGGGTDSPLFVFKHRYDPASQPLPFHVAKLVSDRDAYRELAGTDSTAGFFPPWRSLP